LPDSLRFLLLIYFSCTHTRTSSEVRDSDPLSLPPPGPTPLPFPHNIHRRGSKSMPTTTKMGRFASACTVVYPRGQTWPLVLILSPFPGSLLLCVFVVCVCCVSVVCVSAVCVLCCVCVHVCVCTWCMSLFWVHRQQTEDIELCSFLFRRHNFSIL
jgi:hypothetical protein